MSNQKNLQLYNKDNFQMYPIWFNDFFNIHHQTFEFIKENMENYYKKFDKIFFDWLNQPKNRSKFMFEIKKEFIAIADEVLLEEILIEQYRKTDCCFIIGPLQKYLEFVVNDESRIDIDIDMFPEIEPNYSLLEEQTITQNYIEDTNIDDKYYLSFFQ
jgi:hypothetical protein